MGISYIKKNDDSNDNNSINENMYIHIEKDVNKNINDNLLNQYKIQKQDNFHFKNIQANNKIKNKLYYEDKNNSSLDDYSFYNDNIILYEMKQKFIKEKENSLKELIINEIKKDLIIPLSDSINKKDLKIKEITNDFQNEIKALKKEIENLELNNKKLINQINENNSNLENYKKENNEKLNKLNSTIKELRTQIK